MSSGGRFTVQVVKATQVKPGDTIWVHEDRDWMKVASIEGEYSLEFYRRDGSVAEFDAHDMALKQVPTIGVPTAHDIERAAELAREIPR